MDPAGPGSRGTPFIIGPGTVRRRLLGRVRHGLADDRPGVFRICAIQTKQTRPRS